MGARGYGGLDLAFAALYAYLGFVVAPSRSALVSSVLSFVIGVLALAGVVLLVQGERGRAGRRLGIAACALLLSSTIVALVLLAGSYGFLLGIYGGLGRGLAMLTLVAAALVVELCGLLPLFQLRYHLRDQQPG